MISEPLVAPERKIRDFWAVALFLDLAPKLLIGLGIMLPLQLSIRTGLIAQFGTSPTLAFCMVGSCVIQIWTRPGWRELLGGVACGGALALGYIRYWSGPNLSVAVTCASFLGVGSLAVLAIQALRTSGEPQRRKFLTLVAASVLPFVFIVEGLALSLTIILFPRTYDLHLYAFDAGLGFQPSFSIGRFFAHHLTLQQVCMFTYSAMPLGVAFLYAWHRMNRHRLPVNVLMLFASANVAGFLLYCVFPATGPLYVFEKAFPWSPPGLATLLIQPLQGAATAPRNAIPSVHATVALLVFWNSVAWPKWARAIAGLFLVFTVLATLGFGEHYVIDLVVAVPFSLALQAAWTIGLGWKAPERRNAFIAGSLAVAAWLLFLRIGTPLFRLSPLMAWGAVAATIVPCLLLRRRLVRSAVAVGT